MEGKIRSGGRRNSGDITVCFRGGGNKRKLRTIDFKRDKHGIPATVVTIDTIPGRSARIALLSYADGEKRYIVQPAGLKVGQKILSGPEADILVGNASAAAKHSAGHDDPQRGVAAGQGRADGAFGGRFSATGCERRRLRPGEAAFGRDAQSALDCLATIGQVGNTDHENVTWGKAGRTRWVGKRPHNRGVSMNPVDHPHGGGEGKTSGGRHPVTPWGQPTRGYKTRNNKRTDTFIVNRRKKLRAISF